VIALASSCTPTRTQPATGTIRPVAYTKPVALAALRGDPGFRVAGLTSLERLQYERLLAEIGDAGNFAAVMKLAGSDDVFTYGRTLHGYVQAVLTAFRVTGDLVLLDHVDVIAERMRGELRDAWRGTNDGTDGTTDGYLNWVYRYSDTPKHQGKDTRHIDEIKAHGLVAMVAYALDLNRDLVSPGGRDYGAHADFWRGYLVDHFEAKWRERRGVVTGFPFLSHSDGHTYWTWAKWHLYMGLLTGDDGYLREAHRMADVIWGEVRSVGVAGGPAFVWASNVTSLSSSRSYLMTTAYAHSVIGDVVTFHLEGFHRWADVEVVRAFARTMTAFVFDTEDPLSNGIAPDVGGGEDQAGIESGSGRPRRSASTLTGYQYALIGGWDVSGEVVDVVHRIQERYPERDTTRLAAGLLVGARLNPVAVAAAVNGSKGSAAAGY